MSKKKLENGDQMLRVENGQHDEKSEKFNYSHEFIHLVALI